jgi:hypothetical protein
MSVSYGGDSITFADGSVNSSGFIGHRNRIINGAMVIDQRNAGASVSAGSAVTAYCLDRFLFSNSTDGAITVQQDTSAPTGFINSLKISIATADASLSATQNLTLIQRIEGYNIADLGWGTADAKTVTLSFWVRSSLTGTFGGVVKNSDSNRSYPFTYTINSANTWEYETITIAGDTTGTWLTTNGIGIQLCFGLGAGTDRSGTAGAWNANNNTSATGAVSVIGTLSATWQVTGVQLERGSTASSFEYRSYGTELALCQRYFQRLGTLSGNYVAYGTGRAAGNTTVLCYFKYTTTVRATPTISQSNTGINYPTQSTVTGFGSIYYGTDSAGVELTNANTIASGTPVIWLGNNNSLSYVDVSAEL